MTYVWCTWLADALRAEGCKVREESGWKSRGRPSSSGSFDPYGVLHHHTGTKSSSSNPHPTLSLIINGRSDLPGPLAQALIGYDGTVHVVAAGRANHAGPCDGWGPFYEGDGNAQMIGWEIDYDGTQAISDAQLDAATRASAAVLKRLDRYEGYAAIHAETSSSGKWDTGGVSGDTWRARIKQQLAGGVAPPPETEEWMPALLITDGSGPLDTVYTAPLDLSSKVAITKGVYDRLKALKHDGDPLYVRVDLDPDTIARIPNANA